MRNRFIVLFVTVAAFGFSPRIQAQTASGLAAGTDQTVPNLSGIWEAPSVLNARGQRFDLCGEGACQALFNLRSGQLVITVEEPQMLPWAEEKYKATRREGNQNPNANGREDADPWFSACMPASPTWLMLSPFTAVEVRQFPDVLLLFVGGTAGEADHTVRRIYMDGRDHPSNVKASWMGHSTGRYEDDTLFIDTVGIRGGRWLDPQGHPHTDALHVVERIRRVDQNSMEFEVTITDPNAYKNSWRKKIVRELAASGLRFWDEANCEELLRMGTHYSGESKK